MTKEVFLEHRKSLIDLVSNQASDPRTSDNEKEALIKLRSILFTYSFENRLEKKGTLTHTIIDSLEINRQLAEEVIMFDRLIG